MQEQLSEPSPDSFLHQMIDRLAPDQQQVAEWVDETRRANPHLDQDDLAEFIATTVTRRYTKQGVALGLPGAIPGLGTAVQIATEVGATTTDLALLVRNQSYLVFALSECYGSRGRDVLVQDTLICMGLWSNAITLAKSGAIRIGTKVVEANFKKKFPAVILKAINKKVGTTVLTKYGTKRGGIAVGKLIPFGVGAAVGGTFNHFVMKNFAKSTMRYFSLSVDGSPPPRASNGRSEDQCPRCGFTYKWDGFECKHCNYSS